MANIATTVWEFLKQNNNTIGNATLANDGSKFIEDIYSELTKEGAPDWVKLSNDFTSLATGVITEFTNNSVAGNAIAIRAAAVKLQTDAGQFALGTTSFADVVQSFGGLIEAIGIGMQQPTLNSIGLKVEVAGIMIGAYGALLGRANQLGSYLGTQSYDWWQSVTQADAKREAEIYAIGLSISLGMPGEATAKMFLDGSKNSDFGIGESIEYIKNIRKLLGLGTNIAATTASDVYESVQTTREAIHTLFGDSIFQISDVSNARNDLSAFLSLYYLVPFSIKPTDAGGLDKLYQLHATIAGQWNDDRNLSSEQIANGEANFSDQWIADRVAMLGVLLKANLDDIDYANVASNPFIDHLNNIQISVGGLFNNPSVIFGDNDAETLSGGLKNDHLYGGGGADTLFGGDGNDWLEGGIDSDTLQGDIGNDSLYGGDGDDELTGGSGNDKLYGGKGTDLYIHNTGEGNDVIVDSDGSGSIKVNGVVITGGKAVENVNNLWQSADKRTRYAIYNEGDGTQTLNIFTGSERIFVKKWESGQLGISLKDPDTNPIVATPITTNHDSISVAIGGAMDGLDGNDILKGDSGEEKLYGGAGNDILLGRHGDDVLDGGMGDDILDGGPGHDVMFGGAGNDVIMSNNNYDSVGIHEQDAQGNWQGVATSNENWRKVAASWTWHYEFGSEGDRFVYLNGYFLGFNAMFTSSIDPKFGLFYSGDNDFSDGDVVYGGDGNDAIHGSEGDDYISGDNDDDVITAGGGDDIVLGGTGHDELFGGEGNDYIDGESEDDNLIGGYGSDEIYGGSGSDTLIGDLPAVEGSSAPPSSTDYSQMGNDTLNGGSGDDVLWGGGGADVLLGGVGDDELVGDGLGTPSNYEGADYLDGGAGNDKLWGSGQGDTLYGRDGNDAIYGDSDSIPSANHGDDYIDGGAGDDLLTGQGGNDTIYGGDGNDTVFGDSDLVAASFHGDDYLDGGSGDDQLQGGGGADTILGGVGEDVLFGEDGDDNLNGGADNDQLDGGNGNDWLDGGAGADVIDGGDGDDILVGSGEGDILVGGKGLDTFYAGSGDIIVDQESNESINLAGSANAGAAGVSLNTEMGGGAVNVSFGSGVTFTMANGLVGFGDATYVFSDGSTIKHSDLLGNGLNAVVNLQSEVSMIFGGALNDTIFATGATSQTLFGGLGNDLLESSSGSDTLNGGAGDDNLLGFAGDDTLIGGDGSDTLRGGVGNDTLVGGQGNDTYYIELNTDTVNENENEGVDSVVVVVESPITYTLGGYYTVGANIENATLNLSFAYNLRGNTYNNILTGSEYGNTINGLEGDDTLIGLGGSDQLNGGDGNDVLDGGDGDDYLIGGNGHDTYLIYGTSYAQNDYIYEDFGENTIQFGAGITVDNLTFSTGSGSELIIKYSSQNSGSQHQVRVDLAGTGTISDFKFADGSVVNFQSLVDSKIPSLNLVGTANDDTLNGSYNNDIISGGDGHDHLYGNAGRDIIRGENGHDNLFGDAGNDILDGGDGDDVIFGGDGNDTIDGGAGNDSLRGGMGEDVYLFGRGSGVDNLSDFFGTESGNVPNIIQLGANITAADVLLTAETFTLHLSIAGADDKLHITNFFGANDTITNAVGLIKFADGTSWDFQEIRTRLLTGTEGNDTIIGRSTDDVLNGLAGNDTLAGNNGNDTLFGGDGVDTLYGYSGNDNLQGQNGDDWLYGGVGEDTLIGGAGTDYLRGEAGNDTYILDYGSANDLIVDFGTDNGDVLLFGSDIAEQDLLIWKDPGHGDIFINIKGTQDSVKIVDSYSYNETGEIVSYGSGIEFFNFSDGTTLNFAAILNKSFDFVGGAYFSNPVFIGTSGADVIQNNVIAYGLDGNDSIGR